MLSNYQLKIPDFYTSIASVKKLVPKIIHLVLEFSQSQWLKPHVKLITKERTEVEKMVTKMEKHLQIN